MEQEKNKKHLACINCYYLGRVSKANYFYHVEKPWNGYKKLALCINCVDKYRPKLKLSKLYTIEEFWCIACESKVRGQHECSFEKSIDWLDFMVLISKSKQKE